MSRTAPRAAPPPPAPEPRRRTQAERREGTRAKLLEATLACLVEVGYARTTTIGVAARAGCSQGALFKHFPGKGALLGAAVESLFPRLIAEYRTVLQRLPTEGDRAASAVELLWEIYQRPELQVAVELFVAARTDPELADVLAQVNPPHRARLREAARELFPEAATQNPGFESLVELTLYSVQGLAVERMSQPTSPAHRQVLDVLAALLRSAFEPAAAARRGRNSNGSNSSPSRKKEEAP
ncbi:TetR/AcrR family transcriptional regulator [Aggregicoccus sp. 17bor-14]|uniref:TetR/AcrR family transcriptional regulator n=1 Tax=Myxococcaceae TaxID=31 RepID=UPI00129D01CE|nr:MULTISPECIES: TetR/AcrR family transcriptional regulator [Myxococcaceae]MBF5043453.1 TetR/AcrR family transcriptional regulator [Simulacricoccus sp. 17bor-14]MRI89211.1 TetR/AcrR family transcriptional regulator [Aggregicoccus sp. 17bor-14]